MRWTVMVVIASALTLCACKSATDKKCAKYGELEARCGDIPASEREMTVKLAEGFCLAAHKEKPDKLGFAESFKVEAVCASKHSDCAGYNACKKAAEDKKAAERATKNVDKKK